MLKKKILGAKVLDTNGYVQATRLITPTNNESEAAEIKRLFNQGSSKPSHQLGDIYNANMVDIVAKAVSDMTSDISNINTTLGKQTVVTTDATDTESAKVAFTYATGNTTTKTVTINAISNSEIDSLFN